MFNTSKLLDSLPPGLRRITEQIMAEDSFEYSSSGVVVPPSPKIVVPLNGQGPTLFIAREDALDSPTMREYRDILERFQATKHPDMAMKRELVRRRRRLTAEIRANMMIAMMAAIESAEHATHQPDCPIHSASLDGFSGFRPDDFNGQPFMPKTGFA